METATHESMLKGKRQLHSNVWSDDFIQSLSSPFLELRYEDLTKDLIKDVSEFLQQIFEEWKEMHDVGNILHMVDALMCLGVHRHFEQEIAEALDAVHEMWKVPGFFFAYNLNSTALAFRLLRLNRYPNISCEWFAYLKEGNNGSFLPEKEEYYSSDVISVINLLRASHIQFPGEIVMQEAETFATSFLNCWLETQKEPCSSMHLINKAKYALEYPWIANTLRWEASKFIEFYLENWMRFKYFLNGIFLSEEHIAKIMQLAKLEYNRVQASHQKELKLISKWWMDSPLSTTEHFRQRPIEAYFVAACIFHQPEFSDARIAMAKLIKAVYVLDDIYDACATIQDIPTITDAIQRCDESLINNEFIRSGVKFVLETISESIEQCNKIQNCDAEKHVRYRWEQLVKSYEVEIGWNHGNKACTFNEYMKNGRESTGVWAAFLLAKLSVYKGYPLKVLESREQGMSKLEIVCGEACRMVDDINDFEEEKKHGDVVSAISCYMKENPQHTSTEYALQEIELKHREVIREITKLYLTSSEDAVEDDPLDCKSAVLETTRAFHFMFSHGDGFTASHGKVKDQINAALVHQFDVELPA